MTRFPSLNFFVESPAGRHYNKAGPGRPGRPPKGWAPRIVKVANSNRKRLLRWQRLRIMPRSPPFRGGSTTWQYNGRRSKQSSRSYCKRRKPKRGRIRSGYVPTCSNEWLAGVCGKPKIKCSVCPNQAFIPVTDDTIARHLRGSSGSNGRGDFVIGVYPFLQDDTCWFLAADFDGEH